MLLQLMRAATARHEIVALVDVLDMLDVASAAAAGVDLRRLLWIRGEVVPNPGLCRDMNDRALDRAIKALTLVLQAGNFGVVAFDAADAPPQALQRLPFTTWRRLQRIIEGSQTACVVVADAPMARSAGGITVALARAKGTGPRVNGQVITGLDIEVDVVRARPYRRENAAMLLATYARCL
jgi:hypothetical protein